ncbi:unnamed protein product [Allacma fusca]|uniref:Mpv17-like protein n=1 Tax=Allacma fusca TaxID=39272 RepID=A0A8J2P8Q8_9HEXA|nr:unnamed protein product [Allacma fusca]
MAFLRNAFRNYPLLSNCAIYGGLYVTAEFSQQTFLKKYQRKPEESPLPYDTSALKNYAIVGTGAISPTLYYWYKWLDGKFKGTTPRIVVKKCLIDQFLMTPNILVMFYVGMSLLESREDIFAELIEKFVPTFITSSCFWIPIQATNFTFIPAQYRIVYIAVCTLIWVNILCWFKRQNSETESATPPAQPAVTSA